MGIWEDLEGEREMNDYNYRIISKIKSFFKVKKKKKNLCMLPEEKVIICPS